MFDPNNRGLLSLDGVSINLLIGIFIGLLALSAFFSGSETSMMSLNRYRLRHLVKKHHRGAMRVSQLLSRPDKLIGVILIGNNLINISATIVAGVITTRLFGEWAMAILPFVLTIIVLIFGEVTPKSVAAVYPERISFFASIVLKPLLWVLYPVVWIVNQISNGMARLVGLNLSNASLTDHLHPEELRTVVDEAGDLIPDQHQGMLLNVLDLEKATVEDIMVPRNEVIGIDLEDDIPTILELIRTSEYTRLPVYEGDINKVVGVLHLRNASRFIRGDDSAVTREAIRQYTTPPYFVPESTPLHTQLLNFQKEKHRCALVVDEYGDVQGIATLVDLLEEIVGEFTTDIAEDTAQDIAPLAEDWYLIDASVSVRDINRHLGWRLHTDGPKTLNGIIVEYLESIPDASVCFEINSYRFEVTELSDTRIVKTKVMEKP
jgi:Mg2+/Co2+ transporter CorB